MSIGGKTYGLFDDGDMILLYYRKDLFGNPDYQSEFKSRFGYDLAPPTTYQQYDDIQGFLTEKGNGQFWGGASQRAEGQVFFWFMAEFRVNHGKFFNPDTMDAQINSDAGIKTLTRMLNSNKTMPPGVEKWGFLEVLTAWMAGQLAMIGGTWPPIGRWSEGYGAGTVQLKFVPPPRWPGTSATRSCPAATARTSPAGSWASRPTARTRSWPTCSASGPTARPSAWSAACSPTRCATRSG